LWIANQHAAFSLDLAGGGRLTEILNLARGVDFIGSAPNLKTPFWRLTIRRKDGKIVTVDSSAVAQPKVSHLSATGVKAPGVSHAKADLEWPPCGVPECQGTVTVRADLFVEADSPMLNARLTIDNKLTDAGLWSVEFPSSRRSARPARSTWPCHAAIGVAAQRVCRRPGRTLPVGLLADAVCLRDLRAVHAVSGRPSSRMWSEELVAPGRRRVQVSARAAGHGQTGRRFRHEPRRRVRPDRGRLVRRGTRLPPVGRSQIWMSKGPLDKRDDMPRKLRDGLVWLLLDGEPKGVVQQALAAQDFLGVPIGIHWYNWHKIPFDDDYPHYFPTKDGVADAVKTLKDRGIYVMPYINGRLWDIDTADFKTVAEPACTKDAAGKPYIETYGSGQKLVPMCPTTTVWQDKVCEIIDGLVNKVGFNAVYLDQIAAAGPRQCMDASHGHPLGGGAWWAPAYWKLMDRVQEIGAKKGPEVFFTTENNAESYSQNIDAFLIWNPRRPEMIPINAVVYGGMRVHFANRVHPGDSDMAFAMKVGATSCGARSSAGWRPSISSPRTRTRRLLPPARQGADDGKQVPGLRQDAPSAGNRVSGKVSAEWYGEGKVEHTVTWPAVAGASWLAPDGHVGVIFTNYDDRPHTIDFRRHRKPIN